jgi:hypothetical protein
MPPLLKIRLFAEALVAAMAFVPHPRSLGYAYERFVFSAVPTLIAVGMLGRSGLDRLAGRKCRALTSAAFPGGAPYAFLVAGLGS